MATEREKCVFCELYVEFRKDPERSKLIENNPKGNIFRFEPLNPVVPGHMLFIAALHTSNAAENPALTSHIMAFAAEYAQQQMRPFNLITSSGKAATQSVWHTHIHYVPRSEGDGLQLPWSTPKPAVPGDGEQPQSPFIDPAEHRAQQNS